MAEVDFNKDVASLSEVDVSLEIADLTSKGSPYWDHLNPKSGIYRERVEKLYARKYPESPGRKEVAGTEKAAIHDTLMSEFKSTEEMEKAGELLREKMRDEFEEREIKKTSDTLTAMWGDGTPERVAEVKSVLKALLPKEDYEELVFSELGNDVEFITKVDDIIGYLKSKGRVFSKMKEE